MSSLEHLLNRKDYIITILKGASVFSVFSVLQHSMVIFKARLAEVLLKRNPHLIAILTIYFSISLQVV